MNKRRNFIVVFTALSLLLMGCNNKSSKASSGGPSFVKWDTNIETEREVWSSDDAYQDIYICAIFDNPKQNEIMSLTINESVYPSNLFIRDYEGGLYSDVDRVTVKTHVPNKVGTYNFEVKSLKYLDGTTIKEKEFSNTSALSIKVIEPKERPVNRVVIMHTLGSKSVAELEKNVAEYFDTHPRNIDVQIKYAGSVSDLPLKLRNESIVGDREKIIVIGSLDENDYKDYPIYFNKMDDVVSDSTLQSINGNLINVSKDSNGDLKSLPIYWHTPLTLVNKTELSGYLGSDYEDKLSSYQDYQTLFLDSKNDLYPHFNKKILYSQPFYVLSNYLTAMGYQDLPITNNEENYEYIHSLFEDVYSTFVYEDGIDISDNYYYAYSEFKEQNTIMCGSQNMYISSTVEEEVGFEVDYLAPGFNNTVPGGVVGAYYLNIGDISETADTTEVDSFANYMFNGVFSDGDFQTDIYDYGMPTNNQKMVFMATDAETPKNMKYCFTNNVVDRLSICHINSTKIECLCDAYMYSMNADNATNYYFERTSHSFN